MGRRDPVAAAIAGLAQPMDASPLLVTVAATVADAPPPWLDALQLAAWPSLKSAITSPVAGLATTSLLLQSPTRRATGANYTPLPLAHAIAARALRPILAAARPDTLGQMRILDPACGGGAFLVGALRVLMEWAGPDADPLDLALRHLRGADLSGIALQTTALAVALTAGWAAETPPPDLSSTLTQGDALLQIDWPAAGPFDVVLANPPWFNIDRTWGKGDPRRHALADRFPAVHRDKTDAGFYFLALCARLGRHSAHVLVSRAFLEAYKGDRLRAHLGETRQVATIVDFQGAPLFPGVGAQTALVSLAARHAGPVRVYRHRSGPPPGADLDAALANPHRFTSVSVDSVRLTAAPWVFVRRDDQLLIDTLDAVGPPLGDVLQVGKGMETGRNSVFGGLTAADVARLELPPSLVRRRARNSAIGAFFIDDRDDHLLYTPAVDHFGDLPAPAQDWLREHRSALEARAAVIRGDRPWWRFSWPLHHQNYHRERILCPYLARDNRFAIDHSGDVVGLTDTTVLFDGDQPEDLAAICGVLNSSLMQWRFSFIGKRKGGGNREYFWNSVSRLPIRRFDLSQTRDRTLHDRIVAAVAILEAAGPNGDPSARAALDAVVAEAYGVSVADADRMAAPE